MRRTFTIAFVTWLVNCIGPAWAVNLSFIPGDAFFSTVLTSESVAALPTNGGSLQIGYAYPDGSRDFCGYAGFSQLEIRDASPDLVEQIKSVYRAARRDVPQEIQVRIDDDGKRVETELNGFQVFVCNRNVDWTKQRLGIKYNEKWFDLPKRALTGPRADSTIKVTACMKYVSFVSGARAVEHDWKYAARRAPLSTKIPEVEGWGIAGEKILEPVVVKGDEIQIVVLQNGSVKEAFDEEDGITFYAISEDGVRYCYWDDVRPEGEPRLFDETWPQGE